jgi:adenine phosphoribosyltransferase
MSESPPSTTDDQLQQFIRDIPDWPKPGIVFKDITPLLADAGALNLAIERLTEPFRGQSIDLVAGAESRGFIFGAAVARSLGAGFIPIRKPGKLPWKTHTVSYELEYGNDSVEAHQDAVGAGQRVLLCDDLLATGGTMRACCDLVERMGGSIAGISVLIELSFLNGRSRLADHEFHTVLRF